MISPLLCFYSVAYICHIKSIYWLYSLVLARPVFPHGDTLLLLSSGLRAKAQGLRWDSRHFVLYISFFFFNVFYVFIWLQQVLAAACGIFSWGLQTLRCGGWDLAAWPGMEPRRPALGKQSLSHWITRGVPALYVFRFLRPSGEEVQAVLLGDERPPGTETVQAKHSSTVQRDGPQTREGGYPASSSLAADRKCIRQRAWTEFHWKEYDPEKKWLEEVVHIWKQGVLGKSLPSCQFCCESKIALKKKSYNFFFS